MPSALNSLIAFAIFAADSVVELSSFVLSKASVLSERSTFDDPAPAVWGVRVVVSSVGDGILNAPGAVRRGQMGPLSP